MNSHPEPDVAPQAPIALHQHAEANLRYIRATMESATSFTGISGKAYCIAGITVVIAAALAARQGTPAAWLAVWMAELLLAAGIMLLMTAIKAQRQGRPLWSANGRKLLFAFIPAMTAGGLLTVSSYLQTGIALLPGIWLSLYGAAVMTAGAWSVRAIPVLGGLLLGCGALALLSDISGDLLLGLGMGGLHIVFGIIIWRFHGG